MLVSVYFIFASSPKGFIAKQRCPKFQRQPLEHGRSKEEVAPYPATRWLMGLTFCQHSFGIHQVSVNKTVE
jgi:hypothetical protein